MGGVKKRLLANEPPEWTRTKGEQSKIGRRASSEGKGDGAVRSLIVHTLTTQALTHNCQATILRGESSAGVPTHILRVLSAEMLDIMTHFFGGLLP